LDFLTDLRHIGVTFLMLLLSFFEIVAYAFFVPFSTTAESSIRVVDEYKLWSLRNSSEYLVGVSYKENDKHAESIERSFTDASVGFFGQGTFVILNSNASSSVLKDEEIELPAVFLFTNGTLMGIYPFPDSEVSLLFLLRTFLRPLPAPVSTLPQLYASLGTSPFTLLTPPEQINNALNLHFDCSRQMGFIGIVPVSKPILLTIGINSSDIALFRKEDSAAVAVNPAAADLYAASYPVFRILMESDLSSSDDSVLFTLIAPVLTPQYKDFLFEVGTRFPSYVVGYLNKQLQPYAEQACNKPFGDGPAIAVFNYANNFHYDADEVFNTEFYARPFDVEEWVSASSRLLSSIILGKSKAVYASEDVPPPNDDPLQKVVGRTYEEFIMDSEHDVVILYKRDNCPHCRNFIPVFRSFAEECRDKALYFLKFGFIDITKNSAKLPFPYMPGVPHVQIFPAANKTNNDQLRGGRDRDALIRFLKSKASQPIPLEALPPEKTQVALELFQLLFSSKDMPLEQQIKTMEYIKEMSDFMNLTSNESDSTDIPSKPSSERTEEL